ncbi:tRNA (adenine-N1)-methyltransferase [Spirillospora sp. CA-253888]
MSEPTPNGVSTGDTPGAPDAPGTGRIPHGPFRPGDQVQLTDPKGRINTITLQPGKEYHSHKGAIAHDQIIGSPEGTVFRSTGGVEYLAFRPLLTDFAVRMPRGAAVVYPKDAAQIVAQADIFPGARVVEAGAGSGALSCFLLRAVGEHGLLSSYERREDFAEIARGNVEKFFGGPHPAWRLTVGSLQDSLAETEVDRVVLDMLAPWECVDAVAKALIPGGMVCVYIATTTQMSRVVEELRSHGAFAEPYAFETLLRSWHVEGLAVRPDHRMVGHTGFLVTARRLADGVTPPLRRRRPAKGAYAETAAEPTAVTTAEPTTEPAVVTTADTAAEPTTEPTPEPTA